MTVLSVAYIRTSMGLSAMNIIRQQKKQGCIIFQRSRIVIIIIIIIISLMFCPLISSGPYECAVYQDFVVREYRNWLLCLSEF